MADELQQPYSTDEIAKRPFAVVISLLIGLLLMVVSGAIYIYNSKSARIDELTDKADAEKNERIKMYEQMIFYKGEKERLEGEQTANDSLIREKTEPYVNKILHKR